jgi:8-oxo-dGTP pyrophosphatase MutT (NUDIX family)
VNKMTSYVCGFAFDEKYENVLLIKKNRPLWQKNKKNGIGGHIEIDEETRDAMVREFEEETGIKTTVWMWKPLIRLSDEAQDWEVFFYYSKIDISKFKSMTDEEVEKVPVNDLYVHDVIPNLLWLIPMAIDSSLKNTFRW